MATIGLLIVGIFSPIFYIVANSNSKSQKLNQALKNTHGIVAYVQDDKIGFLDTTDLKKVDDVSQLSRVEYDTAAKDLVKVRWDRTGKRLLLVDEPLENTISNTNPPDTALYVFDFESKKAKKLIDITEDDRFSDIQQAYWSIHSEKIIYVQIDSKWYIQNVDKKASYSEIPNFVPFSPIEHHESDTDTASQTQGPYEQLGIPIRRGTLAFIHLGTTESRNTKMPMTAAAWWYDPARSKKAAKDSDNVKELPAHMKKRPLELR